MNGELADVCRSALRGSEWVERGDVLELPLDVDSTGDGLEVEDLPAGVGVHLHLTVPRERAGDVLRALAALIGERLAPAGGDR